MVLGAGRGSRRGRAATNPGRPALGRPGGAPRRRRPAARPAAGRRTPRGHPGRGGHGAVLDTPARWPRGPVHLGAAALTRPLMADQWAVARRPSAGPWPRATGRRCTPSGCAPRSTRRLIQSRSAASFLPLGAATAGTATTSVRARPRRRPPASSRSATANPPTTSRSGNWPTPCTGRPLTGEDLIRPERVGDDRPAGPQHDRDRQPTLGTGLAGGQPGLGDLRRLRVGRSSTPPPRRPDSRQPGRRQPDATQATGEATQRSRTPYGVAGTSIGHGYAALLV